MTEKSFDELGLNEQICKACNQLEWVKPTQIQALAIPHALNGKNIVALAETGSGKTGAYALPIIQGLIEHPTTYYAVVFAPTRELAAQVQAQFSAIGKLIGLHAILLVGGVPIVEQAKSMRMKPPHVIVSTPGRFVDHIQHTKGFDELKFSSLKYLVIDEADRMLGSDFQTVIEKVLTFLPRTRQTFLFSATMTDKVGKLQRASLRDPVKISTKKSKFESVEKLKQFIYLVPQDELDTYLVYFLRVALMPSTPDHGLTVLRLNSQGSTSAQNDVSSVAGPNMSSSVIVFTRTRQTSNRLALLLRNFLPNPVVALNGDMPQSQRLGALNKFKQNAGAVLVATDVASRGLDIPQVGLVINYDVPLDAKTYMHRVGRTARAGRSGCSLTLLTQYSVVFFVREIEAHLMQQGGTTQAKVPCLLSSIPSNRLTDDDNQQSNAMEYENSDIKRNFSEKELEAACAKLHQEVSEVSVQAKKTVENMKRKGGKKSRLQSGKAYTSINDHVDDVSRGLGSSMANNSEKATASKLAAEIGEKPGMRRTAWASEAPIACQAQIAEVLRVVGVPQTADVGAASEDPSIAANYANLSKAFAKKQSVKAKRRQAKEAKTNRMAKGGKSQNKHSSIMKPFKRK